VAEWSSDRVWISNRLEEGIITLARGVAKGDEIHAQSDVEIQAALKAIEDGGVVALAGR
jgi:hypothetical protein